MIYPMNFHSNYESEGYTWCKKCHAYDLKHKNKPHPDEHKRPDYALIAKDEAPEYD